MNGNSTGRVSDSKKALRKSNLVKPKEQNTKSHMEDSTTDASQATEQERYKHQQSRQTSAHL